MVHTHPNCGRSRTALALFLGKASSSLCPQPSENVAVEALSRLKHGFDSRRGHQLRREARTSSIRRSRHSRAAALARSSVARLVWGMGALNKLACLVAFIISAGEIARFWGSERLIPMALDELLVAAALVWAASRSRKEGASWHLAAWGAFCGLSLVLLVETADHQMHGPVKAAGPVYLATLSAMLILSLWAVRRALRLVVQGVGR